MELGTPDALIAFCEGIQAAAPVDSYVTPVPWAMPGYESEVIMAAGAFVQGSSIELSADGPLRPPYTAFFQGGLTWYHAKLGILMSFQKILDAVSYTHLDVYKRQGLSIAWAVVEHISNVKTLGAKTLFATHYHELTELEGTLGGVNNYCIAEKEKGDDIVFLRKIVKGGADKSYGIQVAKLAGIPEPVIRRAKELVEELSDADITARSRAVSYTHLDVYKRQGHDLCDHAEKHL